MRFYSLASLSFVALLSGCAVFESPEQQASRAERQKLAAIRAEATAAHAAFRAEQGWKKKTFKCEVVMATLTPENASVQISIKDQRGLLLHGDLIAMDFPVATGKRSFPTPTGSYSVRDKKVSYKSNLYGKVFDATGAAVGSEKSSDVPEGGSFVGASMPYWMRLTDTGVGMHVGYVPGHPASHGCIRLPKAVAPKVFEKVKLGTPVLVTDQAPTQPPSQS